jgi:hypothetical protein
MVRLQIKDAIEKVREELLEARVSTLETLGLLSDILVEKIRGRDQVDAGRKPGQS